MSNTNLTQAELATNAVTWDHINLVMKLLASAQIELMRRQFTHDRSKLQHPEVSAFTEMTPKLAASTYGSEEYKQMLAEMKPALDHHYSHNRHHPEFFAEGVDNMNLFDLIEMLLDWYAASQRHNDGDIYRSIEINAKRFSLSPQLVKILTNTVPWIDDEFAQFKTQRDIDYLTGVEVDRRA
jgi:hypothetical protein